MPQKMTKAGAVDEHASRDDEGAGRVPAHASSEAQIVR
jgi:hypothetical protein